MRAILADGFERAEPGATEIVPMASRKGVNLRTHLEGIITNAGHEIWPRLFQILQASCATDWVERYPSHVVDEWLGHSPKVKAQHYLMSRDHHFEDVVNGAAKVPSVAVAEGAEGAAVCEANSDAIATRNATRRDSVPDSTEPHETAEPAATVQFAAGSAGIAPVAKTGTRQEAAQKTGRTGQGGQCGREMAGTGSEIPVFRAGKPGVASVCDAECDAFSADRVELLARAVVLVAGMAIPEQMRAAVLDRVIADLGEHSMQQPEG